MIYFFFLIVSFLFFGIGYTEDLYTGSYEQQIFPTFETFSGEEITFSGDNEGLTSGTTSLLSGDENVFYNTGEQTTSLFSIKIQEIFPKDTELYGEYIGIHFSQSFIGDIRLVGAGNGSAEKVIFVEATTGQVIYITDSPQKISPTSGISLITVSSLTLTDSGEPLEVWIGDTLQDKIIYAQSSSTQAIGCGEEVNVNGQRLCDVLIPPSLTSIASLSQLSGSGVYTTGATTGLDTVSGTTSTETPLPFTGVIYSQINTPFRIEEVYAYDSLFPEYIEILALQQYSGQLTLPGLGQGGNSKTISLQTIPGVRWIVTNNPSKFSFYPFVIGVSGLSLTNNGEYIRILGPNGQQIDSVVYSGLQEEKVAIFSNITLSGSDEVRGFFSGAPPTPGYVWGMITHHIPVATTVPHCAIRWQHTTPIFADKKLNVQAVLNNVFLQNTQATYGCERIFSGSEVTYFTGCNPSYLEFEPGIWPVTLRITKNETVLCELTEQLNLPAPFTSSKKEDSGMSYYEGLYRKRKEKYESLAKEIRSRGFTISSSGVLKGGETKEIAFSIPEELLAAGGGLAQFRIHSVVANPKGKDSEGERLVLENLTQDVILSDTLLLVKGSSSKGLPSGIAFPPGELVEIIGDIGLPNSPACIGLRFRKQKESLALFCYPQPREDEVFTGGMVGFETNKEQERLQELSLVFTESESCVHIGGQEVLCKGLPYPISEARQWKKDARTLISTKKKVGTLQEKYDLRREKYATLSKNNKKREAALTLRNRELRSDIRLEKIQKNTFRSMYWLLKKKLGAERTPLYNSPVIHRLNFLYDQLVFFENTYSMRVGPIQMSPDEVDAWYELYFEGKLPYAHIETNTLVAYMSGGLAESKQLWGTLFIEE